MAGHEDKTPFEGKSRTACHTPRLVDDSTLYERVQVRAMRAGAMRQVYQGIELFLVSLGGADTAEKLLAEEAVRTIIERLDVIDKL